MRSMLEHLRTVFDDARSAIGARWSRRPNTRALCRRGLKLGPEVQFVSTASVDERYPHLISIGRGTTLSLYSRVLAHEPGSSAAPATAPVVIGERCFLGARSTVLPGTVLGDHCVVGAGSVVQGEFPAKSIVVGSPARIIGSADDLARKHTALRADDPSRYIL